MTGALSCGRVTGPEYGRIYDHELVSAVQRIAGNGTGDTRWKVPGTLDWSSMRYNPHVDITQGTTTLYASDRDVFLFLVDDTHPIEAGRLPTRPTLPRPGGAGPSPDSGAKFSSFRVSGSINQHSVGNSVVASRRSGEVPMRWSV
jgi:hypothetical protein